MRVCEVDFLSLSKYLSYNQPVNLANFEHGEIVIGAETSTTAEGGAAPHAASFQITDARGAQVGRWAWDVFLVTGP